MKIIDLHQVDAFTDKLFGGNPAGVVTNADGLTDQEMASIAREMNLSETAFAFQPTTDEADVKLRYFTPAAEVKFCGHATIGALFQLAQLNMFELGKHGKNHVRVETNIGVLNMSVTIGEGSPRITFTAPHVDMRRYQLQGAEFAAAVGVPEDLIDALGTILVDHALNYLYIPTTSFEILRAQSFDFARIRKRFGNEGIVVFCFFTRETANPEFDLCARGLAPNVGIDEDPFTGSMQAALIHAAKQNGYIGNSQEEIVTTQGDFIGRPGYAKVNHNIETDEILVTANAVHVFSTKMEL